MWLLVFFVYFAVISTYIFTTTLTKESVDNAASEFKDVDTTNLNSLYSGVTDAAGA